MFEIKDKVVKNNKLFRNISLGIFPLLYPRAGISQKLNRKSENDAEERDWMRDLMN